MNRLSYSGQKSDAFIASISTIGYYPSEIVLGFNVYNSVNTQLYSGIIEATRENTNYSYQVDDTYKWSNSISNAILICFNCSAISLVTKKTLSQDIIDFKDGAYLIKQ